MAGMVCGGVDRCGLPHGEHPPSGLRTSLIWGRVGAERRGALWARCVARSDGRRDVGRIWQIGTIAHRRESWPLRQIRSGRPRLWRRTRATARVQSEGGGGHQHPVREIRGGGRRVTLEKLTPLRRAAKYLKSATVAESTWACVSSTSDRPDVAVCAEGGERTLGSSSSAMVGSGVRAGPGRRACGREPGCGAADGRWGLRARIWRI